MNIGRILPTEAAAILNVSPQFVRVAMQQGKLPIGTAVQMSSIWTYHISEKLLADYSGKNIEKEIERIRGGVENDEKSHDCVRRWRRSPMHMIIAFVTAGDCLTW